MNARTSPQARRIVTPAGTYFLRIIPDPAPAVALAWRRGLEILQEIAAEASQERQEPEGER